MNVVETHYRFDGLEMGQFYWTIDESHFAYAILAKDNGIASITLTYDHGGSAVLEQETGS